MPVSLQRGWAVVAAALPPPAHRTTPNSSNASRELDVSVNHLLDLRRNVGLGCSRDVGRRHRKRDVPRARWWRATPASRGGRQDKQNARYDNDKGGDDDGSAIHTQ